MLNRQNQFNLQYGDLKGKNPDGSEIIFLNSENYTDYISGGTGSVSSVQNIKVVLTPQDFIDAETTPIEVIPAPGANKFIQVLDVVECLDFNNVNFIGDFLFENIGLQYEDNGSFFIQGFANLLIATESTFFNFPKLDNFFPVNKRLELSSNATLPTENLFTFFQENRSITLIYTPILNDTIILYDQDQRIRFENLVGSFQGGEIIEGQTSGATAELVTNEGGGVFTLTNVVGDFEIDEDVEGQTSNVNASVSSFTNIDGQIGTFSVGEIVTGQNSGATAAVVEEVTPGVTLRFEDPSTFFEIDELIIGADSGAQANIESYTMVGDSNVNLYITYQVKDL